MSSEDEVSLQDLADLAMMRGKVYAFLSGIYTQLPGQDFVQRLQDSGMVTLLDALTEGEASGEMGEGLALVRSYLVANQSAPSETVLTELAVDRTRLVRGLKPGYGPPPPYESVYAGSENAPLVEASASVVQAYAEAGVGLGEGIHDQPDFIGFELDFMRHLAMKENAAWTQGDRDQALKLLEKEVGFLNEHITAWVPRFCNLMVKEARTDFYRGIARLTKGFVMDDALRAAEYLETVIALVWTESDLDRLVEGFSNDKITPTIPGFEFSRENVDQLLASSHCRQCGWCCQSHSFIMVGTDDDLRRIAKNSKYSLEELKDKTVLRKNREGQEARYLTQPCMFYAESGCQIYKVRPFACRVYPISGNRLGEGKVDVSVNVHCDYGKDIYKGLKDHTKVEGA